MRALLADLLRWKLTEPSTEPMNKRLYRLIRESILDGQLAAGVRLPASRDLASEMNMARNTVIHVYAQLLAEGYVHSRPGSGTYVMDAIPERLLDAGRRTRHRAPEAAAQGLSRRGASIAENAAASPFQWGAFMPGVPDVSAFPHQKFGRIMRGLWRAPPPELLTYGHGGGLPALREALAQHLSVARSVDCEADQIVITEGTQQAIDLATRLLSDVGDVAWVEDPGYWGARSVLKSNGMDVHPIAVDEEGMCPPDMQAADAPPKPTFIFMTPSHQYPLGSIMSLARRRQWLALARAWNCWIVEDDYDSEFRYSGHPIASLQGLEPDARVIYVGTFSKTMYPGLRLGYLVLPKTMVPAFQAGHAELYREGHLLTHGAVAAFIEEGHYVAHIRRMRMLYERRRAMLVKLIERRLGEGWLHRDGIDAGLHLVLDLPQTMDDREVERVVRERGVLTRALSRYYAVPERAQKGLVLGYACVPENGMAASFEIIVQALREALDAGA